MKLQITNTFECDDKIAESIILLYKKGYHTVFSCSGHKGDLKPYIKFDRLVSMELYGQCPVNWTYDKFDYDDVMFDPDFTIRRKFTLLERMKFSADELVDKAMIELKSWIESLPVSHFCGMYNEYDIKTLDE
jgi:hypothetical protein